MKYVLPLCFLTAIFISLANCDCTTTCRNSYMSALQGLKTEAQICPVVQTYLDCLQTSCRVDLSSFYSVIQDTLKKYGVSCNLNAASRALSVSLIAVLGPMLLATYGIFKL